VSPRLKYLALAAAVKIYDAFANRGRVWWSPRVGWCAGSLAIGWRWKGGITLANGGDMAAAVKARIFYMFILFGREWKAACLDLDF
jgi:hypothetical protein